MVRKHLTFWSIVFLALSYAFSPGDSNLFLRTLRILTKEWEKQMRKQVQGHAPCMCQVQAHLMLLYLILLHWYSIFYRLKVCGNPVLSNSIGAIFQQHLLTLCFCVIFSLFPQYFKLIPYFYICYVIDPTGMRDIKWLLFVVSVSTGLWIPWDLNTWCLQCPAQWLAAGPTMSRRAAQESAGCRLKIQSSRPVPMMDFVGLSGPPKISILSTGCWVKAPHRNVERTNNFH